MFLLGYKSILNYMKNQKMLYLGVSVAVIFLVVVGVLNYRPQVKEIFSLDPQNATYTIEGQNVALINGRAEQGVVANSVTKVITQYFGNEIKDDFNGDGKTDSVFLLTQTTGGSGTFYYVAVALGSDNGIDGVNALFLGDRIAPQTTEFKNGKIIVNYAQRKPNEPMTAKPSVGVSKYFEVIDDRLVFYR